MQYHFISLVYKTRHQRMKKNGLARYVILSDKSQRFGGTGCSHLQ
jgi:hypothetical protein